MTHTQLLLLFVLITHGLVAGVWWTGGSMLSLSRKAAWHWFLAPVCHASALTLFVLHDRFSGTAHLAVADVLVVGGFIAMRRGLQWFMRLERTDVEHQIVGLGIALYSLGLCVPMNWGVAGAVAASAAAIWVLGRMVLEVHGEIGREFGHPAPWVLTAPAGLMAAMLLARSALVIVEPQGRLEQVLRAGLAQDVLVVAASTLTIVMNFVFGYVVVMRLVRKLQHLSQHDGLTGLLNRRAIEYLLDRETQRLQRFGEPFSVLLVDIDHFKRINDRLGHPAGDAVLRSVAHTLELQAREVDRVARFGGEEFCVLLPHTLREGALQAGERMREAVRRTPVAWEDEFIAVTISVGVASASDPTESLLTLLHRADQALYRAKAEGRDRVVLAPPYGPPTGPRPTLAPQSSGATLLMPSQLDDE